MTLRRTLALLLDSRTLLTLNSCEGCPCPKCHETAAERRELRADLDDGAADVSEAIDLGYIIGPHIDLSPWIDRVTELESAQQRHLELIRKIAQTTPLDSEGATALEQRAALIAEVGTLRARVAELEGRGVGERQVSFSTQVVTDDAGSFSMFAASCSCGWIGQGETGFDGQQHVRRAAADKHERTCTWQPDREVIRRRQADESRYNHTRYDGPFDPCPECETTLTPEERKALLLDRMACLADVGWYSRHGVRTEEVPK